MRLKGSFGCTAMGVDSSNHLSMALKSTLARPERALPGLGRFGSKMTQAEVDFVPTVRVYLWAMRVPSGMWIASPRVRVRFGVLELRREDAGR